MVNALFLCQNIVKGVIFMFFTVDEVKMINERAKHLPNVYVKEMTKIIEDVLNRKTLVVEPKVFEPITKEDYD